MAREPVAKGRVTGVWPFATPLRLTSLLMKSGGRRFSEVPFLFLGAVAASKKRARNPLAAAASLDLSMDVSTRAQAFRTKHFFVTGNMAQRKVSAFSPVDGSSGSDCKAERICTFRKGRQYLTKRRETTASGAYLSFAQPF